MLNRRQIAFGGPVLVASTLLISREASAGIGGVLKKVASATIQGATFITNPAAQVAAALKVLNPLIEKVSPDLGRATSMIQKTAAESSTLEGRLKIIVGATAPQAIPLFANTGFSPAQMQMYSDQSTKTYHLSKSAEDELRGDPYGFVSKNADELSDYVKKYPYGVYAESFVLNPGEIAVRGAGKAAGPAGTGFYPTTLSIGDLITLVSIFRGV
ncbi:hypothetical protein BST63_33315 [Bradyrhizobium canariense]|uniref:Uncharacterized protein n=2 Tax=Bradyrhizobium canariense TaxID=255045 RepID=A0A1X3GFM1_9BRAD|nr:hypothetical protein BSZ22_14810 [Bradyrhizobium canariense]OSI75309.1 hypothetical protein BSZ23_29340 [Bradyrhizobium canariense]OSI85838.1 hypothetical protein BSZ25_31560 [Bradyrhizobium canariense]OSI88217.1 hypothetical protein BSZ24_24920 [Bradyrhizobium canariense]OSI99042.1 hypothetical protein BSZ16_30770 [Bradyrhizobium canariense]